jgi:nucleotide-binding universal stress UspA family protein
MKPERILLPLDIRKCPLEVFSVVNGLVKHPGTTVTLLHVVTLNIAVPENRIYEELGADGRWYLERLARGCLCRDVASIIRVRLGKPAEEILAEAVAWDADLIVLPTYVPSFWGRLLARILPDAVAQVTRKAPCRVFRVSVKGRFDCSDVWGSSGGRTDAVSGRLDGAFKRRTLPGSLTKAALASTCEQPSATG